MSVYTECINEYIHIHAYITYVLYIYIIHIYVIHIYIHISEYVHVLMYIIKGKNDHRHINILYIYTHVYVLLYF